jgi:hypothetical protein
MNNAAQSILAFGSYLILLGCALIVMPDALLAWIGLPLLDRTTGLLLSLIIGSLGYVCLRAARTNWMAFFHWSVHSRCAVLIAFGTYVLLGLAPPALVVFGALDVLGAAWTAYALRPAGDRHAFAIGCHGTGIV